MSYDRKSVQQAQLLAFGNCVFHCFSPMQTFYSRQVPSTTERRRGVIFCHARDLIHHSLLHGFERAMTLKFTESGFSAILALMTFAASCNKVSGDEGPWDMGCDFRPSSS